MLGTASSWLGQSLVVFDVVFLNVGLPSVVSARLCFQDLIFVFLLYRCAELVSWSFGPFYPELCGFSLAWSCCIFLFSL
ncbi:hypothetical protein Bca101_030368 [Brassica carinata]